MEESNIEIPEGYHVVKRVHYGIPGRFQALETIRITRRWWEFWLPATVWVCYHLEPLPPRGRA